MMDEEEEERKRTAAADGGENVLFALFVCRRSFSTATLRCLTLLYSSLHSKYLFNRIALKDIALKDKNDPTGTPLPTPQSCACHARSSQTRLIESTLIVYKLKALVHTFFGRYLLPRNHLVLPRDLLCLFDFVLLNRLVHSVGEDRMA